jgi:predicted neuraminidase
MQAAGLLQRLLAPFARLDAARKGVLLSGAIALVAALGVHPLVERWPAAFAPVPVADAAGTGTYVETIVDGPRGGHTHAPAAIELADGRLFAVWWSGRVEAGPGVSLYVSTFADGRWSPRRLLKHPNDVARDLGRAIKTIGNPSLIRHADGRIELYFVTVSLGGWSGAAVNRMVSTDEGANWSPANRLWTSPVLNLSTLVKAPPIALADGTTLLPTYHELASLRSEMTRIDASGRAIGRVRLGHTTPALQPDLVPVSDTRALAFHRPTARTPTVLWNESLDAGHTWSPLQPTTLATPDSAVATVALGPDDLLIAYNPGAGARNALVLARSTDGGRTWRDIHRVVDDTTPDPRLVAYPWMFRARDGRVHLLFAADSYATLRHVVFDRAWIEARP